MKKAGAYHELLSRFIERIGTDECEGSVSWADIDRDLSPRSVVLEEKDRNGHGEWLVSLIYASPREPLFRREVAGRYASRHLAQIQADYLTRFHRLRQTGSSVDDHEWLA